MFESYTIKDIAKALGLSTSTVSRALNGSYEIGTETKKLVLEYAEKINYRPNPIALSLKEQKRPFHRCCGMRSSQQLFFAGH